jgi:pimeloyl-ACP methyl ester carboxylesterase
MTRTILVLPLVFLVVSPAEVGAQVPGSAGWTDRSPHEISYVPTDSDVRLEVLDWGGPQSATHIVFLSGMTLNAHSFDEFAPRFTDDYRVIGVTRRGHGASSWPNTGYDLATLAQDLRHVLDELNVQRVILAGHSLAGIEMTRLATEQPQRVAGLIYIDSAYDFTRVMGLLQFCPNTSGPEAMQAVLRQFQNPELFMRTQMAAGDDGTPRPYMLEAAIPQIIATQSPPDYSGVRAPALAVYYLPAKVEHAFPHLPDVKLSSECIAAAQRYYYRGVAEFIEGVEKATVVTIPNSQHNLHLASPDSLEAAMRPWLEKISESP